MDAAKRYLSGLLETGIPWSLVQAALILIVGLIAAWLVRWRIGGVLARLGLATYTGIGRVFAMWLILGFAIAAALQNLGFDLSVVFGAAGVLSVAVGFASQTSFSNVISGLFLAMERTFEVGDVITVGETSGEVLSVDLLSVKLRTFDNLLVRIPNEDLIKGKITNVTRFPIRRVDFKLDVVYGDDHDHDQVRALLMGLIDQQPLSMVEPRAVFQVLGSNELGVQVQFSVWAAREHFIAMRTDMQIAIRGAWAEAGLRPPLPRRVHLTESPTDSIPETA